MDRTRPTAFGRALAAQRDMLGLTRLRFADLLGVTDSCVQRWEYGRSGISSRRAGGIARRLNLPAWHFEQALAEDRLATVCRASEVTTVVVGLAQYVERRLPGTRWAEVRAKLLEGT